MENKDVKKAEAKLLQTSLKNIVKNLDSFFIAEKNRNRSLKEKNHHKI